MDHLRLNQAPRGLCQTEANAISFAVRVSFHTPSFGVDHHAAWAAEVPSVRNRGGGPPIVYGS
jgi:hypothetical protein